MADRRKYQMRVVAYKIADAGESTLLDGSVAIDVVLRGSEADINKCAPILRAFLDSGPFYGDWAGIGNGAFVEAPTITLG